MWQSRKQRFFVFWDWNGFRKHLALATKCLSDLGQRVWSCLSSFCQVVLIALLVFYPLLAVSLSEAAQSLFLWFWTSSRCSECLNVQRISALGACWSVCESTQLVPAADRAVPRLCELPATVGWQPAGQGHSGACAGWCGCKLVSEAVASWGLCLFKQWWQVRL